MQQQSGLAPSEIDCEYREHLLRDRVVALIERAPLQREGDPQVDVVSQSIRETLAACSEDPERAERLEAISAHLSRHVEVEAGDLEARDKLLAL